MSGPSQLRIGELSRRSGVSPELLRAWERRYGLLDPIRSPGGLRLYSLADLERVRVMQQQLADGLAAAEAAAAAVQIIHVRNKLGMYVRWNRWKTEVRTRRRGT